MARAAAERWAAGLAAVVLPPLAYTRGAVRRGVRGHAVDAARDAVTALIVDLARELTRHGFAALAIANAHLDPAHLAR